MTSQALVIEVNRKSKRSSPLYKRTSMHSKKENEVKAYPDKQLSEKDTDSRLMKQSTVGSLVGYNDQT
jgi:hypothetical protein